MLVPRLVFTWALRPCQNHGQNIRHKCLTSVASPMMHKHNTSGTTHSDLRNKGQNTGVNISLYYSPCSRKHTAAWTRATSLLLEGSLILGAQRQYSNLPKFDDYDRARTEFELQVPEYYNFANDVVDYWAQKERMVPGRALPALWWTNEMGDEVKWSFQQISQYSKHVANILTGPCKLSTGDRVLVILPKIPAWWLINVAAIRAGIVLCPGTTMLTVRDIRDRLNSSKAKCIICHHDMMDTVDEAMDNEIQGLVKVAVGDKSKTRSDWLHYEEMYASSSDSFECIHTRGSDPMMLFFTSGTTGKPKMAEHTHVSYGLGHAITTRYMLQATETDVVWNLSDTGWAKAAWSSFFAPWIGGSCIFQQNSAKFDPELALKALHEYPVSIFCTPPTAMRMMINTDLTKYGHPMALKHCICAGEPVNPEILDAWKEHTGLQIYEGYGQTETTFVCGSYPCIEVRPGSMGKAAPGIDLQIVDGDGNIMPHGEEGDIAIRYKPNRPAGLFSRYVDDPERTASVFRGDFYLTGDRAMMDDDGYVWFVGRSDDVILSAGYRIGPFEIESALLEHPAVAESAVVSSPDDIRGEVVKAFIILTEQYARMGNRDALVSEIQEFVKKTTAPYKYPRKVEFVEELPKTVSGKIRRVELRSKEWAQH